ncbi:MAG: acyltransferase domain-containing protein, partial [Planctomycetota bacterium]
MTLDEVVDRLELTATEREAIAADWDLHSRADFLFLRTRLEAEEVLRWCRTATIAEADAQVYVEVAGRIAGDEALLSLLAYFRGRLVQAGDDKVWMDTSKWPDLARILGRHGNSLLMLVFISLLPEMRETYLARGFEEEVFLETLRQLERYTDNHKRGSDGACGLAKGSYAWSMFYVDGSLFRRGRLEYRLLDMPESVEVYRRNEDGVIVALYVNDVPLNEAGHCAYVGDDENEFVTWKAEITRAPESVKGYPVRPEGAVEREP